MNNLEGLYTRYRKQLIQQAVRLVGSIYAEDIVQDAIVKILAWTRCYPEKTIGIGELSQAVWFASMTWQRNRRKEANLTLPKMEYDWLPTLEQSPHDMTEGNAFLDAYLATEITLPDRQRECVRLVFIEGLTPTEASCKLGISPNAVRMALHAARKALRKGLAKWVS